MPVENENERLFSVIAFLDDNYDSAYTTIESVIQQSLGFCDNIQLILIDQAASEPVRELCNGYCEKYPENIVYVGNTDPTSQTDPWQTGLSFTKGTFVNFLIPGGSWSAGAFECISNVVDRTPNYDPLNICFAQNPLLRGMQPKRTGIYDVRIDNSFLHLSLSGAFFRTAALDLHLARGLDEKTNEYRLIHRTLFSNGKYGFCKGARYFPASTESKTFKQLTCEDLSYYVSRFDDISETIASEAAKAFGELDSYSQNYLIREIAERLHTKYLATPAATDIEQGLTIIRRAVQKLDDSIILASPFLKKEDKLFLLSCKSEKTTDVKREICYAKGTFYYKGVKLFSIKDKTNCALINIEVRKGGIFLDGRISLPLPMENCRLYAEDEEGNQYPLELYRLDPSARKTFLTYPYYESMGYRVSFPASDMRTVRIYLAFDHQKIPLPLSFWPVTKLTNKVPHPYCEIGGCLIRYQNGQLIIRSISAAQRWAAEMRVVRDLLRLHAFGTIIWRAVIRLKKWIKRITGKRLWLFMDRFTEAGDNAEYLFRHICANSPDHVKLVFCVDKSCASYSSLKKVGHVIPFGGIQYLLTFALCDLIISSQTFYSGKNTFRWRTEYVKDLFSYKWIYLQHGVIKDNHADTQSKHKKSVDMFVTTGIPEYKSLLRDGYGYDENVVKLTGLARYDGIFRSRTASNGGKKVLLAPTWRRIPNQVYDEVNQRYLYNPDFKGTEFYQFYNRLITDTRILEALRRSGCIMELQLHPRMKEQAIDFQESEFVRVQHEKESLEDEIASACMLITDYSSIVFDYAYVEIPVVYAQFDKDAFYANHSYMRGYFDYESDGFGPICYDYESTVKEILHVLENKCKMTDEYRTRVENFFAYRDANNCERIYREILKIENLSGEI